MDQLSESKNGVKRIRLSQFEKHYLNEDTKDMYFIINGQRIPGHKIILSTRSDVFHALLFANLVENHKNEIEVNDTSVEAFKLFIKFIYFDEFDPKDIKDYLMSIHVFKLSHRFEIKPLSDIIEEHLISKITCDNFFIIFEFAMFYKLEKLLNTFKEYIKQNEKQFIENIEKTLIREPIQTAEKFLNLMNISQKQIITALANIAVNNVDQNWTKYQTLIKLEFCSVQDLNALKNIRLFDNKVLDKVIDNKFSELETKNRDLNVENERIKAELETNNQRYAELSDKLVEINGKQIELLANYREVKDIFGPFVDGIGGRVNQYVYNKTNCYLGKVNKKVYFKY